MSLIDREATAEAVERLALYDGDPRWARSQADIAESMRKRAVALIDGAPPADPPLLARIAELEAEIQRELALVSEPVGPFESGAAAAYYHVLSLLTPAPAAQEEK